MPGAAVPVLSPLPSGRRGAVRRRRADASGPAWRWAGAARHHRGDTRLARDPLVVVVRPAVDVGRIGRTRRAAPRVARGGSGASRAGHGDVRLRPVGPQHPVHGRGRAHLAATYATAEPGLTATHAVFLYDMLHPFGLAAERLATFGLGLSLYLFGWATWNGRVLPVWLSWGAFGAGIACLLVPLVVPETSVVLFYAQAAVVVWIAAAGAVMLVRR